MPQKNIYGINHKMISILIPTFNNLDYLKLCLKSLKKNSSFNHEIIIHVNDGSDGTLDFVKTNNSRTAPISAQVTFSMQWYFQYLCLGDRISRAHMKTPTHNRATLLALLPPLTVFLAPVSYPNLHLYVFCHPHTFLFPGITPWHDSLIPHALHRRRVRRLVRRLVAYIATLLLHDPRPIDPRLIKSQIRNPTHVNFSQKTR